MCHWGPVLASFYCTAKPYIRPALSLSLSLSLSLLILRPFSSLVALLLLCSELKANSLYLGKNGGGRSRPLCAPAAAAVTNGSVLPGGSFGLVRWCCTSLDLQQQQQLYYHHHHHTNILCLLLFFFVCLLYHFHFLCKKCCCFTACTNPPTSKYISSSCFSFFKFKTKRTQRAQQEQAGRMTFNLQSENRFFFRKVE